MIFVGWWCMHVYNLTSQHFFSFFCYCLPRLEVPKNWFKHHDFKVQENDWWSLMMVSSTALQNCSLKYSLHREEKEMLLGLNFSHFDSFRKLILQIDKKTYYINGPIINRQEPICKKIFTINMSFFLINRFSAPLALALFPFTQVTWLPPSGRGMMPTSLVLT